MLQIHVESTKNPKIYRKLRIDEGQTLFQLDYILVVVFDLFELDEYRYLLPFNEELRAVDVTEVGEEPIAKWLAEVGDELLFRAGETYEVRAVVELVTDEALELDECLEGDGNILTNRKKKVKLEEVNAALALKSVLTTNPLELDDMLEPDFETLLQLSSELNKLKPWNYFANEQIFAITPEDFDETFFISVMGAGQEEFGVLMFDADLGYASLKDILSQRELTEDFHLNFSALSVNFVDRQELEDEDYLLVKDYGFNFRGKKNWPQFRSYFAGNVPDVPTYSEVEVMKVLLTGIIGVTQLAKAGQRYPELEPAVYPAFYIDALGQVTKPYILEVNDKKKGTIEIEINDLERVQFKRKQKVQLQVEFEMFYLPYPVNDEEDGGRPYFPVVCVVMDRMTGEAMMHDILPFPKVSFTQQQTFWRLMIDFPVRPEKVFVTKEMKEVLTPLAKVLGVELVTSELPNIQEFKEFMLNMPPDFEEE